MISICFQTGCSNQVTSYKMESNLSSELAAVYSRVSLECKALLEGDPRVEREDSCRGLLNLLEQLRAVLATVNALTVEQRAKHHEVTYNAVSYILELADHLKYSTFAFQTTAVLCEALRSMEGNLILQDVKYLDRRTQLYLRVCRIYENEEYYQQAVSLLDSATKSYKELKTIHELDPPVPAHVAALLANNLKLIRVFYLKYSMQAGALSPADWKKKAEEEFGEDGEIKLMSLIECLRTETKKHGNIFTKNTKAFKQSLLANGYEMVKPHLETLGRGLAQQKEKIERQVNFRSTLNATQQQLNEQIKKRREVEEKYVKESEIRKASQQFPLQYHAELIHFALQVKNTKILNELIEAAMVRIECRRIEVPYVNDITIIVSNSPYPNVPNGYTKIPVDLNEANLKKELAKLRKSGKKAPDDDTLKPSVAQPAKDDKKDSKKGGKDAPPAQPPSKQKEANAEPSEWELSEIKHKYVFMMVKKSMSAENALYDLGVVLGNEEKGPVGFADNRRIIVPYIQQNMKILESEVSQHTGVRQTTNMVPYLILYHSRNSLEDEHEQKSVITDISPLIGKNPMVPARWGYRKIDLDLRQVPAEFIRAPNHDYVYLTYKTDELFPLCERHVNIIKAFSELQSTCGQRKGGSNQEEKLLQLQVGFEVGKLDRLFECIQQALRGELGQEYYLQRSDFLTQLCFQLWSKYLRNCLLQFDFVREQRLNGEVIDYDYNAYKKIIEECSPVFLRGLKVMNLIMLNNPKADVLLQSRINLELAKMLEEGRQYKTAADNLRLCLDRLRVFRDEYLSKGVEGACDRILPFSLTCSNRKIGSTIEQMKKMFNDQRRQLQRVNRMKDRQRNGYNQLSPEQLQEEQKEFIRLRKPDNFDQTVDKVTTRHTQLYSVVYALELDLLNLYFRVTLKRSEELSKIGSKNDMTNGVKNSELEGLATTLKQKLGLNQGPTQTKNIQNLTELQNTLVKASKLPTPKPTLEKPQVKLIAENQKNPYALSLLMVNLAALNSQSKDKRYYLQESLNYLEKSVEVQGKMLGKAVENAIFIFSGLWDSSIQQDQNSEKIHPFKDLYTNIWQQETEVPEPPILVSKNSTTVHLKLPPFLPARHDKKEPRQVKFMSVYGKPSANGVDVSLNCVELQGTGIRKEVGKTVKISSLDPNNVYCFAAAGVDQNQETMGIGRTGQDIGTFNPLSIPMLASYLAKVSYQINQYDIAEKAARLILDQYCQQSKYLTTDERNNNLYFYTINEQALLGVSLFEIKSISEALYVAALCERRKLNEAKEQSTDRPIIVFQEREKLITNLLLLSATLTPSLSSPNMSIPFLIPENEVLLRAITLNMIPEKWMNPKIRRIGVGVMQKLLKWGLQNNEIALSRRLVYRWNERKYLLLGKMIQIEQKKQIKKGAKDSKEQEVKIIDKYCRLMIEKSPQLMDAFEDSIAVVSEEYYDYVAQFVERAKEQVASMAQFVDNSPEEIDAINSHLSLKLQLIEYLREPLQSIKKIVATSPYYLEYNSKILKKGLEVAAENEYKQLLIKAEELQVPDLTEQIKLSKEIYELMFAAIREDIAWNPSAKQELIQFQQKTGKDLSKAITIFTNWQNKKTELTNKIRKAITFQNRYKDYDYLNMWIGELHHLRAQCQTITHGNDFAVKRAIKVRYDKIKTMNLEDLFKKETEVAVLQDKPYAYSEEQLKKLTQIMQNLCQAVYAAMVVQNWLKLQTILKFLCNLICYIEITPFYHRGSPIWTHFTFISLCAIHMLERIKSHGFSEFRNRYHNKLMNTEMASVNDKLQLGEFAGNELIDPFIAEYKLPELDSATTKSFWFLREKNIDIQAISSVVAYTMHTLRLEGKHNLVINVVRDFCNVTQHYFSLVLLPFMTNSQAKLQEQIERMIQQESAELMEVHNVYAIEKEKKGKKRAAMLSGEKLEFQIVYEQRSAKLKESLRLLNEQKSFSELQTQRSNRIKDEISRDTSKQVMAQKEQKKYTLQFGQHYQQMAKEFGEEAKHVKRSRNVIKNIINKYAFIYQQLKNSKTSKDTLTEIQNRNDLGNLSYAHGNLEMAYQSWNDSLATIFREVNPIEKYHAVIQSKKPYLVKTVGEKEVILAICLLYKIANFGCAHKLQIQRASSHFACHLAFSLFEISLDYPQTPEAFKDFRIRKFPARQLFSDQDTINLTQLLAALEYFILRSILDDNALSVLPLATFYEYIATDVVKNVERSVKAKCAKAVALAEAGLISEAIGYLTKVANEKDLPILWLESSDYLKKEKGMNWVQEGVIFNNTEFWTSNDNKAAIEEFKKLMIRPEAALQCGILSPIIFSYAKALILFKIFENEICKDEAINEQRLVVLSQAEVGMRESLKKLAIVEEFFNLLQEYENAQLLYKQNEVSDDLKKQMETARIRMVDFLKKNGIQDALIKVYEKETSTALKRATRLEIMCRIRLSLHRLSEARNLYTNSYFILKNGLANIQRYSIGARLCETGYDPEIKAVVAAPAPTGKKDDKKGGKKQEEAPAALIVPPVDLQKEKELRSKAESKLTRSSLNSFCLIKMLFEIGKILFKQNNFREATKLFETIIEYSQKYEEEYFRLLSRGYICRAKLRLGSFQAQEFQQIIQQMQAKHILDANYVHLTMDFGEVLSGSANSLQYLKKGREAAGVLWQRCGMKATLSGIGLPPSAKKYYLKEELNAQQEEAIKRKKKGEKKGGKDDKKAPPKKEDPKKKKEDSKVQYKVTPLSKVQQANLLEEEKLIFGEYSLNPHPNYKKNNIYQVVPLLYIKAYLREIDEQIRSLTDKNYLSLTSYLTKLLHVLQSYAHSTEHLKIILYACLGKIYKLAFIQGLKQLISNTKPNYLNLVKTPFQDLPLNSSLINIPAYSQFLAENKKLLLDARTWLKKCITLAENSTLFYQRATSLEDIAWQYADNQCLLAEYVGRDKPKFFPEDQARINYEEIRLEALNSLLEASGFLESSIKIKSIKSQLSRNYLQIGSKGLDAAAKIDEDINAQIMEMDKESKRNYPQFLLDTYKGKGAVTGTDLITYMLKIYRQAEYLTFANPNYQNQLFKCNRILTKYLPGFKEKCTLPSTDVPLKKSIKDKFVENDNIIVKSQRGQKVEVFLYVLGAQHEGQEPYYGRINIDYHTLSKITEDLLSLTTKTAVSDKKSEAVKTRDYLLHRKEFKRILQELSYRFSGSPDSSKPIPEDSFVELTADNLKSMNRLLDSNGFSGKNKDINKYLRHLHRIKYQL